MDACGAVVIRMDVAQWAVPALLRCRNADRAKDLAACPSKGSLVVGDPAGPIVCLAWSAPLESYRELILALPDQPPNGGFEPSPSVWSAVLMALSPALIALLAPHRAQ
jgi:hypothetical protein